MQRICLIAALVAAMLAAGVARASAAVNFQRTDYPLGASQTAMAVGDLDGKDGSDLVAVSAATGNLTVLLNNGDGTFGAPVTYPLPAGCAADQIQLSDFENTAGQQTPDGNLDAMVYCTSSHMLVTLAGNGDGGFGAPQTIPLYLSGYNAAYQSTFAIGAFGYYTRTPFVVYSATESNEISGPYFCSLDNFSHPDPVCQFPYVSPEPEITGPMVAVDFDGSGQQDLLTTGGTNGVVIWLQSPGPPVQWTYEDIPFGQRAGSGANALVAAGDLNGDGVQDIVTASSSSLGGVLNTILWKGSFWGAPQSFPSVNGIDAIVTGDFDGDGHTDVMAVTEYGQAVVQSDDGAGNLGTPQSIPLIGNGNPDYATVVQAAEADIDANGTPDVVVLDDSAGTFEVLRNLTTPPSTVPAPQPVPPAPTPGPLPPIPVSHPAAVARPLTGITRLTSRVRLGPRWVMILGQAANPPTSSVRLTLTVLAPKPKATGHAARAGHRPPKRIVVGRSSLRIPSRARRSLRLTLNRSGRRLLAGHARMSARLTIVATGSGSDATRQTRQRKLTILRRASRHSRLRHRADRAGPSPEQLSR